MITIEEKIKLFNKLLNQTMEIDLTNDLKEIKNTYELKLENSKNSVDKEAKEIEERALKRAEIKRAESISKSKVIIKKDIMALKEKCYYTFMEKFIITLKKFVNSNEYKTYLSKIISKLSEDIKDYGNSEVVIYITNNDKEKYSDLIISEINKINKNNNKKSIVFETTEDILGGIIAKIPEKNIKVDISIDSVLEDNKTYIMQTIFETLEAGDYNG